MDYRIEHSAATDLDREAVLAPLRLYNRAQAGDARFRAVSLAIVDVHGHADGGLWGKCAYDWLFVELLAVPEAARGRGLGRALMARAEAIARDHQCVGIRLETYDFQARGFYEKLGFTVFGTLEDYPIGHRCFFLKKDLRDV